MHALELLGADAGVLLVAITLLGLVVGSFLNVVILRLPRMMQQAWECECRELLHLPVRPSGVYAINLVHPPSSCPKCGHRIRYWQNIPVLSWLMLGGRCARCSQPISVQYPVVEATSGFLSAICAVHFGWSTELLPALLLTWILLALAVIDTRTLLLPDNLTLPLLWLGLLLALVPVFAGLQDAVLGAAAGYLSLWTVYHLFKLVTGKEGMGYGDFKLLAALGAWLGWQSLPSIILASSLAGALVGLGLIVARRTSREIPIPFGPFLAGAGWLSLLWRDDLQSAYLSLGLY